MVYLYALEPQSRGVFTELSQRNFLYREFAMNDPKQKQELKIEINEHEAEGVYSNLVIVSHTDSEFILDFARMLPGKPKAKVHSRVIMNPKNCRLFLSALQDNINKFEGKFGKIPSPPQSGGPVITGEGPQNIQ